MNIPESHWRIWPWLFAPLLLAVMLVTEFYFWTGSPLVHWRGHVFVAVSLGVEVFLLAVIAICAWVQSKTHPEVHFMDVFHRHFHGYGVYFVLLVLLMTIISVVWLTLWNNIYWNGACTFFLESRWEDIKKAVIVSPVFEEAKYRVLPFIVVSIPMVLIRSRKWKWIIGIISALMIVCVQLQFGYRHYLAGFEEPEELVHHLVLQGTTGLLFAIAYGLVLVLSYKTIRNNQKRPSVLTALFASHLLAFIAADLVHAFSNLTLILLQTF